MEVQVDVFGSRSEFAGVVVAQVRRIEQFEVLAGSDHGAFALGHFLFVDGQESVDMDKRGQGVTGGLEDPGPKQRMEVGDVFADEMVDFGLIAFPPIVQVLLMLFAPLPGRSDVTDGCIEPDVPVIPGAIGNCESEIGFGA